MTKFNVSFSQPEIPETAPLMFEDIEEGSIFIFREEYERFEAHQWVLKLKNGADSFIVLKVAKTKTLDDVETYIIRNGVVRFEQCNISVSDPVLTKELSMPSPIGSPFDNFLEDEGFKKEVESLAKEKVRKSKLVTGLAKTTKHN